MGEENNPELQRALEYYNFYYGGVYPQPETFALMIRNCPDIFAGYMRLGEAILRKTAVGGLGPEMKEYAAMVITLVARKVNPPTRFHTAKALQMGITPAQMAELCSIAIAVGSMESYWDTGRFVLKAIQEHARKSAGGDGGSVGASATGAESRVDGELERALAVCRVYFSDPQLMEDFELLVRYCPAVVGYLTFRAPVCQELSAGFLSAKDRELLLLAAELAPQRLNPAPVLRAVKAVELGATLREISEIVGIALQVGGMVTYQERGRFALKAAETRARELSGQSV